MRSVSVPRAVRMMIGTPERARIVRQTSRPSPSGRWRSSRIRSGSRLSASSSARAAVRGDVRLEALAGERLGERLGDRALVLDEQDAGPLGDRHAPQCRRGVARLCPGLTLRWRALGGSEPIVLAMKPSRHQIAAGVTVVALGVLATVALASGGDPRRADSRPAAGRQRRPRCGPRSSARPCTAARSASSSRRARVARRASSSSPSAALHGAAPRPPVAPVAGPRPPAPRRASDDDGRRRRRPRRRRGRRPRRPTTTATTTTIRRPRRRRRRRRPRPRPGPGPWRRRRLTAGRATARGGSGRAGRAAQRGGGSARKPGSWRGVMLGSLAAFFVLLAFLAVQVRAGGDPALGPAKPAATPRSGG